MSGTAIPEITGIQAKFGFNVNLDGQSYPVGPFDTADRAAQVAATFKDAVGETPQVIVILTCSSAPKIVTHLLGEAKRVSAKVEAEPAKTAPKPDPAATVERINDAVGDKSETKRPARTRKAS